MQLEIISLMMSHLGYANYQMAPHFWLYLGGRGQ